MSKICTNCGVQLDDETMFCTNCGAEVAASAAPAAPAPEAPAAEPKKGLDVNGLVEKAKKDPKILIIAGVAVVAILAILIAVLWNPIFNPWKSGLDNYVNLVIEGKSSSVTKAAPKDVWEYVDDEVGISKDDFKKDAKKYAADASETAKDTYGDNVNFKYKVVKSKKMTKDMIEAYGEGLENRYDIDADSVKNGYVVEYEFDISGKTSFTWGEGKAYIVKIGTGWYMVSSVDVDEEDPYCSIMALSALQSTETYDKEADYK